MDGATGLRRFQHITFPLMAQLYLVSTLLSTIFSSATSIGVLRDRRRAGDVHRGAGHTGHSLRLHPRRPRLGVAAVMTSLPVLIPLVLVLMHSCAGRRCSCEHDRHQCTGRECRRGHRPTARRPRYKLRSASVEAVCMVFGLVLAIWSLAPVYNMVLIALSEHGAVFSGDTWPHEPSFHSFWVVWTQASGTWSVSGISSATASSSAHDDVSDSHDWLDDELHCSRCG